MINDLQTKLKRIGDSGCYFLCLCAIAEKVNNSHVDPIVVYDVALYNHWIEKNCYVLEPCRILEKITEKKWEFSFIPFYSGVSFVVQRYKYKNLFHFQMDGVFYPIADSNVAKNGKVDSLRCFRIVEK